MIIGRTEFKLEGDFTWSLTVAETTSSSKNFTIDNMQVQGLNRQTMSGYCARPDGYKTATKFPTFDHDNSGFTSNADSLAVKFTMPRPLYDVVISFDGSDATAN